MGRNPVCRVVGALLGAALGVAAEVRLYPAPVGEVLSADYRVTVDGRPADVNTARVNDPPWERYDYGAAYGFVSFDFSGRATVRILSRAPLDSVRVLPASSGVLPRRAGDTLILDLERPVKLSVEPTGRKAALLLFANALETSVPAVGDPKVIRYGPGVHEAGRIRVGEGQTLYLEGGAVVKGTVIVTGRGAAIRGRGILCGNDYEWGKAPGYMVAFDQAVKASLSGIVIRGSPTWTVVPRGSDSVDIDDLKICNSRVQNDDGINPVNSRNVTIRNSFIRTDDDCIAMKGLDRALKVTDVENIKVEDCVLWGDRARIFLLGHESRAAAMRDITLRNLDIIHFAMAPFLLEPGENMLLRDVLVERVRLNAEYWLPDTYAGQHFIALRPVVNEYMVDKVPGRIRNVRFRDVALAGKDGGAYGVLVQGADEAHRVDSVSFENVTRFGTPLARGQAAVEVGDFTGDITFVGATAVQPAVRAASKAARTGRPSYRGHDLQGRRQGVTTPLPSVHEKP